MNIKGLDYRGNFRKDNYIPMIFNNNIVFISYTSFQQNNKILSIQIRKLVQELLNVNDNVICIGGESYIYPMLNPNIKNIVAYTNNISIYNDMIFNDKIYHKNFLKKNINYNKLDYLISGNILIINLSKLDANLCSLINKNYYKKIIIINCHYKDFWKKIKLLSNYELKIRKQFYCFKQGVFISVNLFEFKQTYISLGGNCAVSYQMTLNNKKNESFPFDWSYTKIIQLINVLNNNFKDFNSLEIVKYSPIHLAFKINTGTFIIKNPFGITFAHEVLMKNNLYDFSLKLKNRINKFKKLINPCFVRLEINKLTKKQTNLLYKILIKNLYKFFKHFKLILITEFDPEIPEIIYIPLKEFDENWKYENINWKYIFSL